MISTYQTDPDLLKAIEDAAGKRLSLAELFAQRVSWVYGMTNCITKNQIIEVLKDRQ